MTEANLRVEASFRARDGEKLGPSSRVPINSSGSVMTRRNSPLTHSLIANSANPNSSLPIRIVVLGTGTAIGKTFVSRALTERLGRWLPEYKIVALKPLESGLSIAAFEDSCVIVGSDASDASTLAAASQPPFPPPKPPYFLPDPLSPHLSARRSGQLIECSSVLSWIRNTENTAPHYNACTCTCSHDIQRNALCSNISHDSALGEQPFNLDRSIGRGEPSGPGSTREPELLTSQSESSRLDHRAPQNFASAIRQVTLIETAGGVFSPLNDHETNFELASHIERSIWILVAPDRLGVLHDLTVTLATMRTRGKVPDLIVLSQPSPEDPSLNTNLDELHRLGIAKVDGVVPYRGVPTDTLMSKLVERIKRYDNDEAS